jgi:hypothetical protein
MLSLPHVTSKSPSRLKLHAGSGAVIRRVCTDGGRAAAQAVRATVVHSRYLV